MKKTVGRLSELGVSLVVSAQGRLLAFVQGRGGVSTVEYALITIAVISIVGGSIAILGGSFQDLFDDLGTELDNAQSAATAAGPT